MIEMTRENAIDEVVEAEYDSTEWDTMASILRHGCLGVEDFTDEELAEAFFYYFDEELKIVSK